MSSSTYGKLFVGRIGPNANNEEVSHSNAVLHEIQLNLHINHDAFRLEQHSHYV